MLLVFGINKIDTSAAQTLGTENVRTLLPDTNIFFGLFTSQTLDALRPIAMFISRPFRLALELLSAALRLFAQ